MNKKKLLLALALVAVVLFLLLRPRNNDEKGQTESTKQTETQATAGDAEIVILSVNDMHASIDQFPKFAALVDSLRAVYPDLLVMSAGDNRTGEPLISNKGTSLANSGILFKTISTTAFLPYISNTVMMFLFLFFLDAERAIPSKKR